MDLSNPNKTPFGEMTDAEKGALLLAHHRGEKIEWYYGPSVTPIKWRNCPEAVGKYAHYAYRVRPEPKRETVTMNGCASRSGFWNFYDADSASCNTHRIAFTTIDGEPDCSSVKMEEL